MDAPEIGPANIASSPMTAPTAMPAVMPFSAAPVETLRITNIKSNVRINSSTNDWIADPAGSVAPNVGLCGNRKYKMPLAANAHGRKEFGSSRIAERTASEPSRHLAREPSHRCSIIKVRNPL